jgi:hypothetical protein
VDSRAGLDDLEKRTFLTLQGLELQTLGRPARSQSLYRLRYSGSPVSRWTVLKCTLERKDGVAWIGSIWLRIGASGGLL